MLYFCCKILYSVPNFCFHHFLLNILIVINTLLYKHCSSTRMKKFRLSVLKRSLYCFRFQFTTVERQLKSMWISHCNRHEMYRIFNDNVKKLCNVSRVFLNGEKMSLFPFINHWGSIAYAIFFQLYHYKWP